MSATKARRKWALSATVAELQGAIESLERSLAECKNPVVRSSLREQVSICKTELSRKQHVNGEIAKHLAD